MNALCKLGTERLHPRSSRQRPPALAMCMRLGTVNLKPFLWAGREKVLHTFTDASREHQQRDVTIGEVPARIF
eukprot:scaffold160289_cov21-Tisochrysis_lutea.AAC.1